MRTLLGILFAALAIREAFAGLAMIPANDTGILDTGILIVYGTSPGTAAADGSGRNGLFTESLLHVISEPNLEVGDLLHKLRESVRAASQGRQVPWVESSLSKPFYFSRPGAEVRKALVIGNAAYVYSLPNALNDARDMGNVLEKQGFEVTLSLNSTYQEMSYIIKRFLSSLTQNSIGLFYFAGHGVQIEGKNYIIPIDTKAESADTIKYSSIDIEGIIELMTSSNNHLNIVFLDAARTNPFKDTRIGTLPEKIDIIPSMIRDTNNTAALKMNINAMLKRLYTSNVKFEFPNQGRIGKSINANLVLSKNDIVDIEREAAIFEETMKELRKKGGDEIIFSNSLEAKLIGIGFEVTPITPPEQMVNPNDDTAWYWLIKPVTAGAQTAHLTINSVFTVNGKVLSKSIYTKESLINVTDNLADRLKNFIANNWAYIMSTILIPLFAWWWNTRKKRSNSA